MKILDILSVGVLVFMAAIICLIHYIGESYAASFRLDVERIHLEEVINGSLLQSVTVDSFTHKVIGLDYNYGVHSGSFEFEGDIENFVGDSCRLYKKSGEFKITIQKGDSVRVFNFKVVHPRRSPASYSKVFNKKK
jgi:hypothetical protein